MASIGEVYFDMYGDDFDPAEVSVYVGCAATDLRRKGQRRPDVPFPRFSSWRVSTGITEADVIDVYEMSQQLVEQLLPFTQKLAEAKTVFNLTCKLQVVLWIDQNENASMPAIGFDTQVIDFIHKLGATIDIDTYRH